MTSYAYQAENEMWDDIARMDAPKKSTKLARTADVWAEHYSARNCLTLAMSGATEVAGYREWQALGRQVRKGEKGIALIAPVTHRDSSTGETRVVNMKTSTVFDIAQTDPK